MGLPKNESNDHGMDAPDQDWQWELLERTIQQAKVTGSTRDRTAKALSEERNATVSRKR